MPEILVGCSGFNYFGWKKRFYPEDLPQRKWLEYYSSVFRCVELNVTFYRLPTQSTFKRWYTATPKDFSFVLKGSRLITHVKRLNEVEEPLRTFFERALVLGEKLKVTLWQFSAGFKLDIERLEGFLKMLSHYKIRAAFEFRNESWINEDVINMLAEHGFTLCMADWPSFLNELPVKSNYVYIRRHGHQGDYSSCYTEEEISSLARRIKEYAESGKDVYIFFNNDAYAYAVYNARQLIDILKSYNLI